MRPELLPQFAEVRLLHDEDDIGPRDERRGEPFLRVAGQSRRGDLDAGVGGEDRFGCRAAQPVPTTDEENMLHLIVNYLAVGSVIFSIHSMVSYVAITMGVRSP